MGLLFLFQAHAFTQPAFLFFWMFPPLAISRDLEFLEELWSECGSPVCTYLSSQEHRRLSCIELIPAGRASWKRRHAQEPVSGERWEGPPWSGSGVAKAKGLGTVERQFAWGSAAEVGCEVGGHGLNTGSMETQGEQPPSLSFLTEAGAGSTVHASVSQRPVPFLAGPRSFGAVPHPSCACRKVNPGACSPRRCLPHAPGAPGSSRASTIRGSGYPPRTGSGAQWHQERGAGWGSLVSPLAQAEPIGHTFWSLIPFSFTNL